ncbi:MAG: hypothetical protein AAFY20_21190 [Cyanobacteria bacterium J06639_14]
MLPATDITFPGVFIFTFICNFLDIEFIDPVTYVRNPAKLRRWSA